MGGTKVWLAVAGLVTAAAFLAAPSASAGCQFDGSVPGTPARTYAVSVGGQTLYVDDRDYADADQDDVAGGIWIYLESNRVAGLQRGGSHVVLGQATTPGVSVTVTWGGVAVGPQSVTVPGLGVTITWDGTVVPAQAITQSRGEQNVADATGANDPCVESATPDTILF